MTSTADDSEFEIDSIAEEEESAVIDDDEGAEAATRLLGNLKLASDEDGSMVYYKGERVKREVRDILVSIVDKMQFHFNGPSVPPIEFVPETLVHLPYDEKYKSKNDDPSDKFQCKVNVCYTELNSHPYSIVAFDNCYIDLSPHVTNQGRPVNNYGISWVNIYFPKSTMKAFTEKFKGDTTWGISNKNLNVDNEQGLVSATADLKTDFPPVFFSFAREKDEDGKLTGNITISNRGSIQSIYSDEQYRAIYKCTLFLSIGMTIPVPVGTTTVPSTKSGYRARIKFTVASLRAYGIAEDVEQVKLGGTRINSNVFG